MRIKDAKIGDKLVFPLNTLGIITSYRDNTVPGKTIVATLLRHANSGGDPCGAKYPVVGWKQEETISGPNTNKSYIFPTSAAGKFPMDINQYPNATFVDYEQECELLTTAPEIKAKPLKVKLLDDTGLYSLEKGKIYEVDRENEQLYQFKETGEKGFNKSRFAIVTEETPPEIKEPTPL